MISGSAHNALELMGSTLASREEHELLEYGRQFSDHLKFPTEGRLGSSIIDEVNARVQVFQDRIPTDMHTPGTAAFTLGIFANICARLENGEQL